MHLPRRRSIRRFTAFLYPYSLSSSLFKPSLPIPASGAEECAYGVEWHIPHPSLVAVRRKGKSHALKVFVRGDEGILHFF